MKIGVISDSHVPSTSPRLPARVAEAFKGLDIILHVGDVCELHVLQQLQETYTLTFAVCGEADDQDVRGYQDEKRVVRFRDRRVGMIHGHQFEEQRGGVGDLLRRLFRRWPAPGDLEAFLLAQFAGEEVDAIVFGHTHRPYVKLYEGVLLFNPGAAMIAPGHRPSAGILEVGERSITGRIVYLSE